MPPIVGTTSPAIWLAERSCRCSSAEDSDLATGATPSYSRMPPVARSTTSPTTEGRCGQAAPSASAGDRTRPEQLIAMVHTRGTRDRRSFAAEARRHQYALDGHVGPPTRLE